MRSSGRDASREPVVSALIENGLYRVLLPQSLGGAEAPPEVFMQILEEIAKADASTAWCLGQCNVCSMTAAYIDPDAANEIFNKPPGILAWGAVANEVQVVPGGYRITGRWDFASGSRQASWLGAHVQVIEADGSRRLLPSGAPEIRTILFPMTSATMYDVWDVIGLSGTGTDSYSVDNLFIPEKFAALRDNFSALREKGPLYGITTYTMFGLGFGAIALGVARATLDAVIDLARGKESVGLKAMRENQRRAGPDRPYRRQLAGGARPISMGRPPRLGAISPARESSPRTIGPRSGWPRPGPSIRRPRWSMPPITWPGATAVFKANKFERRFRDMHAIAQQIQARDAHYEDVGRMILTASSPSRADRRNRPAARPAMDHSFVIIRERIMLS